MRNANINVRPRKDFLGRTENKHERWTRWLNSNVNNLLPNNEEVREYKFVTLDDKHEVENAYSDKIVVINNGIYDNEGNAHHDAVEMLQFGDFVLDGQEMFATSSPRESDIQIKDDTGYVVATFNTADKSLNIHFDAFKQFTETYQEVVSFILRKVDELYFLPEKRKNSWIHTVDQDALAKRMKEVVKQHHENEIRRDRDNIRVYEERQQEYRRKMTEAIKNLNQARVRVTASDEYVKSMESKLVEQLDSIVALEQVKDLRIEGEMYEVETEHLNIFDPQGVEYVGGTFTIKINPANSDVRFFGTNTNQSYWSQNDPHPHVDGNNGQACLGNVSGTIAELSSQYELYALVLTALDFLQNVNPDDPAGRNIANWKRADGKEQNVKCSECRNTFPSEEMTMAFDDEDDARDGMGAVQVCGGCRGDYFHYNGDVDEYVRD